MAQAKLPQINQMVTVMVETMNIQSTNFCQLNSGHDGFTLFVSYFPPKNWCKLPQWAA